MTIATKRWALPVVMALAALAWGQAQFIRGFDSGADTTLCVIEAVQFKTPVKSIEACQRVPVNGPSMVATRWYRAASGDVATVNNVRAYVESHP